MSVTPCSSDHIMRRASSPSIMLSVLRFLAERRLSSLPVSVTRRVVSNRLRRLG